jgi:multicomponent Na+:H+ antiporter subunit E
MGVGGRTSTLLWRGLLLAGAWWLLAGDELHSWMIGLPCIVAGVWASAELRGLESSRLSIVGLAQFVPFFLSHSLRGGVDVARRLFQRRMPLQPGLIRYQTQLLQGRGRLVFVNIVSLLPGTLSTRLDEHGITVHVLDNTLSVEDELGALEAQVANMLPPASKAGA